jgi:uncharacterized protein (DUF58 family)
VTALPHALLDWGEISPLKLRARQLSHGLYTGAHRSRRRGSGIEFDGHRDYVPGDDLRRLDSRALLRHGRLLVRQFETDTDRNLCLLLDATSSMAFKSGGAPAAKLAFAALLAAALGRIGVATGDTVSLDWIGGEDPTALPSSGGREAFERLVVALERAQPGGDDRLADSGLGTSLAALARRAKRGAIVVVLSDLLDLPESAANEIASLATRDRRVVVVQVLDPVEATFPFTGAVRLKPSTGAGVVETDADRARQGYLQALAALQANWSEQLHRHGARLLTSTSQDKPSDVLRQLLALVEGDSR